MSYNRSQLEKMFVLGILQTNPTLDELVEILNEVSTEQKLSKAFALIDENDLPF